jgi:hypothetical protein
MLGVLACSGTASAGVFYADFIEQTQDVTFFGSGILIGAPDGGGAWLSNSPDPPDNLGFITAGFTIGLIDGAGDDIVIHDCCGDGLPAANEFADVFVSNNGTDFTFLGFYGDGVNSFDLNGVFGLSVHFVKIVNTSMTNSPDIDAFQGNYIPVPSSVAVLALGAVGIRRKRKRAA